ncbi:MAG: flagellar motor protein MotA [Deltaproteobacteria bacterium]|nr:flagellar motor protein MotA [Deltaproteobacteria bacterium]HCH61165.1 flagellar motor protein MotA [Deltaproteobacteria bacterium]
MTVHSLVRVLVDALATPVQLALLLAVTVVLIDVGIALGERAVGLARLASAPRSVIQKLAEARIERSDVLARTGPMLGLMGTLIPLGPGLAALGRGDVAVLAQAVTVAFDTTVMGLLVGVLAFVTGRLRRRWYDALLTRLEAEAAHA